MLMRMRMIMMTMLTMIYIDGNEIDEDVTITVKMSLRILLLLLLLMMNMLTDDDRYNDDDTDQSSHISRDIQVCLYHFVWVPLLTCIPNTVSCKNPGIVSQVTLVITKMLVSVSVSVRFSRMLFSCFVCFSVTLFPVCVHCSDEIF